MNFFEITNLKYPLSPHGAVMTSIGNNSGLVILGLRRARDGGTPGSIAQHIVVPFRKKFNEIDAFVASDLLFFGSGSFINQRESRVQPSEQSLRSTALCKAFYLVINLVCHTGMNLNDINLGDINLSLTCSLNKSDLA